MTQSSYLTKNSLFERYEEFLRNGGCSEKMIANILNQSTSKDDCFLQASSGRRGNVIYIPRDKSDILDILKRVMKPFVNYYQTTPKRVALIGGISHNSINQNQFFDIQFQSFNLDEINQLIQFEPDVIACYPSILRDLLFHHELNLQAIKAFKLGGEPLYPADLIKINEYCPQAITIEQFGSTEMPASAIRWFYPKQTKANYQLQDDRFDYKIDITKSGWQKYILRDKFEQLMFNMRDYYDTGDDLNIENNQVIEFKCRQDPLYKFREEINDLYLQGCINLQFDLHNKMLFYQAPKSLPAYITIDNLDYQTIKSCLQRLPNSNKLALIR